MINEMIDKMQSSWLRVAYLVANKSLNMSEVKGDLVMMNHKIAYSYRRLVGPSSVPLVRF